MSDRNLRIRMLLEAADRFTKPVRQMAAGARATGRDIAATRDRLKALGETQERIGRFREIRTGLSQTQGKLDQAKTKVSDLARAIAATDAPTKKMTAEFTRAKREAAGLKDKLQAETQELQRTRTLLSAAGISTAALARHERELRDRIARTNAELAERERRLIAGADRARRFSAASARFDQVNNRATGLAAGGAASIATGMAIGRPLMGAADDAAEYEASLTTIGQKADLTRGKSQALGRDFLKIARAANQMPAGIRDAVDVLTGFGLSPAQARSLVLPIARTATAYKAEIGDLSTATFSSIDNLKVPINQAQRALDAMALAGNRGAFEIKDMAQYFPGLSAGYQALNQRGVPAVADLAAALQITRKGAGDSASAAINLENIINKMQTGEAIKNFQKFGIDLPKALKKAYAEGKTPIEAIAELTNKAVGGDLSKIGFLFGDMQVQAGLRPLIQNLGEYRRIRAEAMNAGGTVDTAFADRMNDSAEKMQRLRVQANVLKLSLGSMLLPAVTVLAEKGAALATTIGDLSDRNPVLARNIALAAAGLALLFVAAGGVAIVMSALMAPFAAWSATMLLLGTTTPQFAARMGRPLMWLARTAFPWLGRAALQGALMLGRAGVMLLMNPVGLAITAIVLAVGGAAFLIWKHWDRIKAAFAAGGAYLGGLAATFHAFGANLIQGLVNGITSRLAAVKATIVGAAASAIGWFKDKLGIHSPSRVFMQLGGFVMDGLDRGIDQRKERPITRIAGLSRELTAALAAGAVAAPAMAAMPAAPAGAASARLAASASVTIGEMHIHAAPGQNPQDIARAVRAEIEKIRREGTAAGRSTFADAPDWRD